METPGGASSWVQYPGGRVVCHFRNMIQVSVVLIVRVLTHQACSWVQYPCGSLLLHLIARFSMHQARSWVQYPCGGLMLPIITLFPLRQARSRVQNPCGSLELERLCPHRRVMVLPRLACCWVQNPRGG